MEKRFAPTAKKLRKAREKGDIAKSRDLTALTALAGYVLGSALALTCSSRLLSDLYDYWSVNVVTVVSAETATRLFANCLQLVVLVWGGGVFGALIGELLQVGPLWSTDALAPNLARCNPFSGLSRMLGLGENSGLVLGPLYEGVRTLLLIAALVAFGLRRVHGLLVALAGGALVAKSELTTAELFPWMMYFTALAPLCSTVLVLALLDLFIQRQKRARRLRMDIHELKRELRESSGSPETEQRRRTMRQELSESSRADGVRNAAVVVAATKG